MYISDRFKAVFIHIPKTGGTALRYAFPSFWRHGERHSGITELPRAYEGFFIYAVVRNPYERLASRYRFHWMKRADRRTRPEYRTFGSFVKDEKLNGRHRLQSLWLDERVRVFRYERFNEAVQELSERFQCAAKVPARQYRTHYLGMYDWRDWVDQEGIEYINDVCDEDFRLGYKKQSWESLWTV